MASVGAVERSRSPARPVWKPRPQAPRIPVMQRTIRKARPGAPPEQAPTAPRLRAGKRRLEDFIDDDSDTSSRTGDVHENDTKDDAMDHYHGVAKISQRAEFAINCKFMAHQSPNRDILYLETAVGMTTQTLLANGFAESDLHPCNYNHEELAGLAKKYPGVVVHEGDILEEYKRQRTWLGIWFDLETSLLKRDLPDQPWDKSKVPTFSRAVVCAVSLSHRGVRGTTEQFAVELQALMQIEHGFVTSPQMARAFSGRSNKQNMVFALAHYEPHMWHPKDYLHQRVHVPLDYYGSFRGVENYMQEGGHLVATVSRVSRDGKALHLTFMSKLGYFFENEDSEPPVAPGVLEPWIV